MIEPQKLKVHPEQLAYWYFRLNGFLTTVNFVVHHDTEPRQETDADILGVRFPYRAELLFDPMPDEGIFTRISNKPYVVIAEVKTRECKLNGPWTRPEKENVQRVLRAMGMFPPEIIDKVAQSIYKSGIWEDENYFMSLACVGKAESRQVSSRFPNVPQITWGHILEFVYDRFTRYRRQKANHQQWDNTGKRLLSYAINTPDKYQFIKSIEVTDKSNQHV